MERSEIKQEYKWNLSDVYENYSAWEKDFEKVSDLKKELAGFKGKFGNEGKLLEFFQKQEEMDKISYKLYRYPQLARDLNSSDKEAVEHLQKVQFLFAEISTELSWVNSELVDNRENIEKWIEKKEFDDYRFGLKNLFRLQKHILEEKESKLLSYYSSFFSAPRSIYSEVTVTDVEWPQVTLSSGEKVDVTPANYSKILSTNRNQEDRKLMFQTFYTIYEKKKNTIAAIYNSILQKGIASKKAYNYDSFLLSHLESDNIPEEIYLNLVNTAKNNTKPLQRYLKLRKKILGLEKYYNFDGSINLIEFDKEYEYDDAKEIVLNSVAPLGKDYVEKMKKAISEGWLDVFEAKGKRTGAYSAGVYGVHPYMLLNYNKTLDSVFTLAHELGHTLHTLYSDENQPFSMADYTIFVAEVASTFNERLLLDYMLENTNDPKERIALLEQEIGNIVGTFYFQALLADYEYQAHKLAEAGEPITAEVLSKIMEDLFDKYYGDIIEKDDLIYIFWARVPHFFNSPFYVYQYATCFASSAILYEKMINSSDETEKKQTLDKYIQLLSSGGNDFPMEQLKKAGVDLSKIETIEAVAKQFDLLLDKLEVEIGKL
ncbi:MULTISPECIES: oligoendopeptidase F [unclassified Leptotrichia]|uniref:oligoendopeptidase F n=1 Tax=unclassified Leptotrichia TaxID=2633022 RepID=UPI0003AE40BF|nr:MULTISPECIES: oligoendopeptidase F [unclassified Leptotrichia]ERL25580.1 oligoendopeptidase F [Leptotrichia sp. oral taxon 225 str. F0581]WLD73472.1 oligoendopeptidase F [Leptotrichia sp. HMT-225]